MASREMMGLTDQILDVMNQVELQIGNIKKIAQDLGCEPHEVRSQYGELLMMAPLLAKSNLLNALAILSKE